MVYLNEKEKKESRKKNTTDNSITHIRTKWKKKRKKKYASSNITRTVRAFIKHTTTGVSNRSRPWNKSYAYLRSRVSGYEVTIKTFIIFFPSFITPIHRQQAMYRVAAIRSYFFFGTFIPFAYFFGRFTFYCSHRRNRIMHATTFRYTFYTVLILSRW